MSGVDVKHPLRIAALDASVGRRARLPGSRREGPESAPKASFRCEREIGFSALWRGFHSGTDFVLEKSRKPHGIARNAVYRPRIRGQVYVQRRTQKSGQCSLALPSACHEIASGRRRFGTRCRRPLWRSREIHSRMPAGRRSLQGREAVKIRRRRKPNARPCACANPQNQDPRNRRASWPMRWVRARQKPP